MIDLHTLILNVAGLTAEPEFCSLDHVCDFASEHGNPETLAIASEERLGRALAFERSWTDAVIARSRSTI